MGEGKTEKGKRQKDGYGLGMLTYEGEKSERGAGRNDVGTKWETNDA